MATLKDLLDEQERQKQLLAMMAMGGDERALGNYPPQPAQQPSQGNYSDMFDPSIPLPPAKQYTGNTLADIARNPNPNWSQETKDALARRADLSGTLRISHNGQDVSDLFGGGGGQPQQPAFRNTLQVGNNAPVDLGQSQPAGLSADWARPVDVMGAKGHWASDNSGRIILRDGRIVDLGRDTGEERKRRLADAEIAKREAEVRNLNAPSMSAEDKAYQEARGRNRAEAEASRMPGTKEYLAGQEEITRKNKLNSIIQENAETALEAAKIAKPKIGYFSTGLPGQLLSNVGGTDAKDLEEALRPIKALTGFDKLQELREMSKTGGALGQVAVEELRFLQSVKGSLDTAQSEQQFRQILSNVEKYYEGKRNISGTQGVPTKSAAQVEGERKFAQAKGMPPEGAVRRIR